MLYENLAQCSLEKECSESFGRSSKTQSVRKIGRIKVCNRCLKLVHERVWIANNLFKLCEGLAL